MQKTLTRQFEENKKKLQERVTKLLPPKEVMKEINNKTEEVFKMNNGNLDKESFRLGMMSMWIQLNKDK